MYASDIGTSKYIKQMPTDLKAEVGNNIIREGNINTPFFSNGEIIQTENQQEIWTATMLDQMDITNIYRTFHPTTAKYTLFSSLTIPKNVSCPNPVLMLHSVSSKCIFSCFIVCFVIFCGGKPTSMCSGAGTAEGNL